MHTFRRLQCIQISYLARTNSKLQNRTKPRTPPENIPGLKELLHLRDAIVRYHHRVFLKGFVRCRCLRFLGIGFQLHGTLSLRMQQSGEVGDILITLHHQAILLLLSRYEHNVGVSRVGEIYNSQVRAVYIYLCVHVYMGMCTWVCMCARVCM